MTTRFTLKAAISSTPMFTRRMTDIPCGGPAERPTGCAIGPTITKPVFDDMEMNDIDGAGRHAEPRLRSTQSSGFDYSRRTWHRLVHPPVLPRVRRSLRLRSGACGRGSPDGSGRHSSHRPGACAQPAFGGQWHGEPRDVCPNQMPAINYMLKRYGGYYVPAHPKRRVTAEPDGQTANPITETQCVLCPPGTAYRCTSQHHKALGSQHMLPAGGTTATFTLAGFPANATATVIGENLTE